MIQNSSVQPGLKVVAREALANLASLLLFPFGLKHSGKKTPRRKEQRTVVLVHGYLSNRSSLLPLLGYLRALGFDQVLAFNYRSGRGIERAAVELRDFLRHRVRGGRIDIVGHSLGGVIARVYLQQLGGARRVDRCITLGTPHQGTYGAYWIPSQVGRDMRPESPFLERLRSSRTAASRVKFTYIVGALDNVVLPRAVGAEGEDFVSVPEVGHVGMLFSRAVLKEVAKRLLEDR